MSDRSRARQRAIRARAAREGVPYSVAARQLASPASQGRTIYPDTGDPHRDEVVAARARWTFQQRLADTRRAADLPYGRARHLADRFPPTRGEPGSGVRPLYAGTARADVLARLYEALADLAPPIGDLAWEAELGEETAVDTVCAALDRAARRLIDADPVPADPLSLAGARDTLDALLIVADDGHAPGTRVRLAGRPATVVGALWGPDGPPYAYEVTVHGEPEPVRVDPDDLVLR